MIDTTSAKAVDLLALIGKQTPLRKVAGHEYAGPCPKCGGHDRFRVDPDKGWWCRQCTGTPGDGGHWMDAIDFIRWQTGCDFKSAVLRLGGREDITPDELERRAESRRQLEEQRAAEEAAQRQAAREQLAKSGDIATYNANLKTQPDGLRLWAERGIPADWCAYWGLGYCPERQYKTGTFASLTIPYWRCSFTSTPQGDDVKWYPIDLKHRLIGTSEPGMKYRHHLAGCGNNLYLTDPMHRHLLGDVLIVEGEIKAMVTWIMCWNGDLDCLAPNLHVVGVPGKNWKPEFLADVSEAERVFICLDPDGQADARRMAKTIGDRARVLSLPEKIDDLILCKALTFDDLRRMME